MGRITSSEANSLSINVVYWIGFYILARGLYEGIVESYGDNTFAIGIVFILIIAYFTNIRKPYTLSGRR